MRHRLILPSLLLIAGSAVWTGCASSSPSPASAPPTATNADTDRRHQAALQNFIEGAVQEVQGNTSDAILDYQEALRLEPNAAIYDALAKAYSSLGKHARAAEAGHEAVRLEPANVRYHQDLASVYVNAMQPEKAIREFEEVVRLDSNATLAWYNLARLQQAQRPLRALEIYNRLLDRQGDDWDILLQCATIYSSLGRFAEEAGMLERMLALDPSNRALQRQLAETYAKAGRIDDAVRILESLVEQDQKDSETAAALADVYLQEKKFDKAVALYERILAQGVDNPEVKLRIGIGLFGQSDRDSTLLPRARQLFEEVRTALPNDWRAYWYLGAIAASQKNDSLASENFERVTALAAWNADAWWFLGTNYFDHGQYDKVVDVMERAQKAVPRDARVSLLLGLAYSRMGRSADAINMLEKSYRMNPGDLNTLSSLALEYETAKRYDDAYRIYEEALKIDSTSALILNNYAYSMAERGLQLERALAMAQKAVAAEPDNSSYLDTLGWIYYQLGQYEKAKEYIAKAVSHDQASSVVHEHLGDVYYKLGDKEKAMEYWKQASSLDPKNDAARGKAERGTL